MRESTDDPMSQVREGMTVVDAAGDELGTVRLVQMGDPQAVTAEGQAPDDDRGLIGGLADALVGDRSLPPQAAAQLARVGYLQVDPSGLGRDLYVSSEQVGEVSDERVRLTVGRNELYS